MLPSSASTPINLDRTTGLITEGVHLFKVTSTEERGSKSSGQPTWFIDCECQDQGEDKGKKFQLVLSLVPAARFKVDQFLDAIEAPKQGSFQHEMSRGKLLKIAIVHGEYNGNPKMDAFRMLPSSSNATVTLPSKEGESRPSAPELGSSAVKKPF